jgi:GTP cyclohydrolase I
MKSNREELIKQLLDTIPNEDSSREGLLKTPERVSRMYDEIFSGYEAREEELFKSVFFSDNEEMVVVRDIDYYSQCEHHMVPFFGKVHIGYIPEGKVLGLSKFARLVEVYARRLQIQEQMTFQIASAIEKHLNPKGLIVVVTGTHLCMCMRGVKKANAVTITSAVRGCFKNDLGVKEEFLKLIKI